MTPYFHDDHLTVYQGDCREVMAAMEPESVHCVVTSPPYWGLRDYGTATWIGGDEGCDHRSPTMREGRNENRATLGDGIPATNAAQLLLAHRTGCGKCGAVRQDSQLGLEPTPEAFVANMVDVFREVRRVLRKDGTLWLNLGDSYSQGGYAGDDAPSNARRIANGGADGVFSGAGSEATRQGHRKPMQRKASDIGLKPKDLVGIPWRVAFALQADGWYLRSDIIWAKPNPMPESVTDRPTKAHEYLFLLTKSARYYYDADAVREENSPTASYGGTYRTDGKDSHSVTPGREDEPIQSVHRAGSTILPNPAGRNLRSVWTIATAPYPGAHFATFPPKLVEPCVKAGCPEGGLVLDPFAGSGTTGMVAQALGRRAVLIDLNGEYLVQAMARNAQTPLGMIG